MRRPSFPYLSWLVLASRLYAGNPAPSLEVVAPNGGEAFAAGSIVPIAWRASSPSLIRSVDVLVSYDNGATFETIGVGLANSGALEWRPDARSTSLAILRVEAVDLDDRKAVDECDAVFSIGDAGEAPGGGGGVATSPLPTTVQDFKLPGTQPGTVEPVADPEISSCTFCHKSDPIGHEWEGTMMANASIDPLFEACLAIAEQDAPGSGDLCLRCHIPKAWVEGRSTPTNGSAVLETDKSGVSCNFCHRMVNPIFIESPGSPELGSPFEDLPILAQLASQGQQPHTYGNGMFVLSPTGGFTGSYIDGAMRGPRDTWSPGHPVLESPFHRESDLCGTCHDVSNPAYSRNAAGKHVPNGFNQQAADPSPEKLMPIERTYSEWLHSEFAQRPVYVEGYGGEVQSCQDCHMRGPAGQACFMGATRDDVVHHDLTGGNSWVPRLLATLYPDRIDPTALGSAAARAITTLQRAAKLQVRQMETEVRVTVTNLTGHKLPTGYPEGRRMWLQVKFKDKDGQLIKVSGDYDTSTGELVEDPEIKVYEVQLGIDSAVSALTGIPAGHTFHFVLNNVVLKDNRIPPRGFTNDAFREFGGAPVNYLYRDGQHSDVTDYSVPLDAASAEVTLFYQTASKEYIEFLRDKNVTNDRGRVLYNLWRDFKSPPVSMAQETIELNALTTVFVDQGAAGAGTGTSWEDAFPRLEDALAAADANECITHLEIAGGTYTPTPLAPSSTFQVRGKLRVSGGYGRDEQGDFVHDPARFETILDGRGLLRHVVTIAGGPADIPASLSHVTIRGGNATGPNGDGGGVHAANRSVTLQSCRILENAADHRGGGIFSQSGRLSLDECEVRGNSASHGGGAWAETSIFSAVSSTFDSNIASAFVGQGGGVGSLFGTHTFTNCVWTHNRSFKGGALFFSTAGLAMTNCTLAGNEATAEGGGLRFEGTVTPNSPPRTIVSSIFWGNADAGADARAAQLSSLIPVTVTYSCVEDGSPADGNVLAGAGNIDRDPLLFDTEAGLLALTTGSPCIDAGDSTRSMQRLDVMGRPRRVDDPGAADAGIGPAPVVDMGAVERTVKLYVDQAATGLFEDGRSWRNAYRELRDALAEANEAGSQVAEVWVAEGTYRPAPAAEAPDRLATFLLRDGLSLVGGFAGEDGTDDERDPTLFTTVLSGDLRGDDNAIRAASKGDNSYHVVTVFGAGVHARLEGFTIRAGNAEPRGGTRGSEGGGLLVDKASLTLRDCLLTLNVAETRGGGAAVLGGGSLDCERCRFRLNRAGAGGGLAMVKGKVELESVSFRSNTASDGSGGGLVALDGSVVALVNVALALNEASQNGGGLFSSASNVSLVNSSVAANLAGASTGGAIAINGIFTVSNSILWSNLDSLRNLTSAQLAGAQGVSYSCIQGGWNAVAPGNTGNVSVDPRFSSSATGDLRLLGVSPCIDAGSNDLLPTSSSLDLLGNPRRVDLPGRADSGQGAAPIVDMGAFEAFESEGAEGRGDADGNGRVDLADAARFVEAMTGPDATASAGDRGVFDADRDQDIDLLDFLAFQGLFGRPPAPPVDRLDLRITSEGSARASVEPGEEISYEVRGVLVRKQNDGLAAIVFDLGFSGGPLEPADLPTSDPMRSFIPFAGITNPGGFGGTPVEGILVQVGGAQNTLGTGNASVPYPSGRKILRGVAHEEVVLATGKLRAPSGGGKFRLEAANLVGAVYRSLPGAAIGPYPTSAVLPGTSAALEVTVASTGTRFRRADSNGDGKVDISDSTFTLASLFLGGRIPACLDSADTNDDGRVDISDAVATLAYLFLGAATPPAPGVAGCGEDPSEDAVDCREYDPCQP